MKQIISLREDMDEHRKVCSLEVVSCKYMKLGCGTKMAHKEVEEHGKEKVEEHLCLATERLEKLEKVVTHDQLMWFSHLTSKVTAGSQVAPVIFRLTGVTNKRNERANWRSSHLYTKSKGHEMYVKVNHLIYTCHLEIMKVMS